MWKRIAALLIVLSVALNVAFISAWAVHAVRQRCHPGDTEQAQARQPLHRRLNLTDEQQRQIEARLADFQRRTESVCADMNDLRSELIDLLAADSPDRRAIAAKQEQIRAGQRQMQDLVVDHLLAQKEILTPDQQEKLFDLIRQRNACQGPGRMMGIDNQSESRNRQTQSENQE